MPSGRLERPARLSHGEGWKRWRLSHYQVNGNPRPAWVFDALGFPFRENCTIWSQPRRRSTSWPRVGRV